jgi:predicted branched-subunit amino acid permease
VPSVFVYGSVLGGLAVQAGLRPLEMWTMSVLVFAGASQFVAVPMIAAGAPVLAIVVTTYVINMRHYLMAATLAPSFRRFPRAWIAVVAHLVNDESFAVAVARGNPPDPWLYLGSAAAIAGAFVAGVVTGTGLGGLVDDPARWGLDFAFPAVFLALVAAQVRTRGDWIVASAAGALALGIALVLPGTWHIVIAGVVVSAAGAVLGPRDDNAGAGAP